VIEAVFDATGVAPQRREWTLELRSSRIGLALATLALIVALIGAAVVGARLAQVVGGAGTIAYTTGHFRWTGAWADGSQDVVLDDTAVFEVPAAGGEPMLLFDLPFDAPPSSTWYREGYSGWRPRLKWAPDGSMFAYRQFGNAGAGPGIYVASRDGSGRRLLVAADTGGPGDFAWSPDGARIAFITRYPSGMSDRTVGSAMTVDVASGQATSVIPGQDVPASGSIAWSPDGTKIAFGWNRDRGTSVLVIADLSDGGLTTIDGSSIRSDGDALIWNQVGAIAWSPDSRKIAFDNERIARPWQSEDAFLMIVNADGTGLHDIDRKPMGGCCIIGAFLGYLEWSPDADLIAWGYLGEIVLAPADGSGVRRTIEGIPFDWSPDGDRLVIVDDGPPLPGATCQDDPGPDDPDPSPYPCTFNSSSIFTLNRDGTERTWIVDGADPTWLPAAW
jgi:Tol biopolymer transport system component